MTTFTDAEAKQHLSNVLEQARAQGEVRIKRADGVEFVVRPATHSSLDVGGIDLHPPITIEEIVQVVREGRERG